MTRERWETADGDFLDVDLGPDPSPDAPVCLVLHGLEGSSQRRYVLLACARLLARGVRPVALSFRGCSGEPNRLPRWYHSGETGDPLFVLERLRALHPRRPLGALGFSLGGNALLKLLGERADGGRAVVVAAAAVSVPYDLALGAATLEASFMGRCYARFFLKSLRSKVRSKARALADLLDVQAALAARTIREFDDAVTAPIHGFENAAQYYGASSSSAYLAGIGVPTLLVHGLDDPFLPGEAVPRATIAKNPDLVGLITSRGGHVGFMGGTPWSPHFWAEETAAQFLAVALRAGQEPDRPTC
jgi:hypothetical protein